MSTSPILYTVLTRVAFPALALLAIAALAGEPPPRTAPIYSTSAIAKLADGERGKLCPNTLAVIMGTGLANGVWARQQSDLQGDLLPTALPGTGVTVKVNGLMAAIEYASPTAVVFLVPSELQPGVATIVLTRSSVNGPVIRLELSEACPALFLRADGLALGSHADSQELLAESRQAEPGEEIIIFAAGLGATDPPILHRKVLPESAALAQPERLQLFLNERPIPSDRITYVGALADQPGLYAIRFRLPRELPPLPEVRLCIQDQCSRPGVRINAGDAPLQPASHSVRSIQ